MTQVLEIDGLKKGFSLHHLEKDIPAFEDVSFSVAAGEFVLLKGANGAGKSSLLEAITWVVWGKSRVATEDDIINGGAKSVRVDFDFSCNGQTYRVIRSRTRGRSSSLEFQVETKAGNFRSITAKGLRATQEEVISCLKLDYDTFTNSAYLRQGRADEFMLRRPSDRKQVLADLLKLDRYEKLSGKAKDTAKEYKGKIEQLEQNLEPLAIQLTKREEIAAELSQVKQELARLQETQEHTRKKSEQLRAIDYQRETWEKQLTIQQAQSHNLTLDCDRTTKDISSLQGQLRSINSLIQQEAGIVAGYNQLIAGQTQEKDLSEKFAIYQELQQDKQQLERQLVQQKNELNLQINQLQTRLESIEQQEQENAKTIAKIKDVEPALARLKASRQELAQLDKLQQYISPLTKRKLDVETQISREEAKLLARLEQLSISTKKLAEDIEKVPEKRNQLLTVDAQIEELNKRRVYQTRVKEKGTERREFQTKLQENQRIYERQIYELNQKIQMLTNPDASCPLCDRALDEHHRHQVIDKTEQKQQEIEEQIWVIREQLSTCDREIQLLINE